MSSYPVLSRESLSVLSYSLWPHGLYSPWNSPGQNTGVGGCSLHQGILPTLDSNPGLPHCRWILYQLSYQGSPAILEWVADPFFSVSSQLRNWTGVSCIAADSLPDKRPDHVPIINFLNFFQSSVVTCSKKKRFSLDIFVSFFCLFFFFFIFCLIGRGRITSKSSYFETGGFFFHYICEYSFPFCISFHFYLFTSQ